MDTRLQEKIKEGSGYVIPSVVSAGIVAGAIVELVPYFADKPNATIILALGLYTFSNYALIFFKKYSGKVAG